MTPRKSSRGFSHSGSPSGAEPYVLVRLAPGWRLDEKAGAFVAGSERVPLPDSLPRGTRARLHVPALASRNPKTLSEPERELARYVQVLLPKGADAGAIRAALAALGKLAAVEQATVPPAPELP